MKKCAALLVLILILSTLSACYADSGTSSTNGDASISAEEAVFSPISDIVTASDTAETNPNLDGKPTPSDITENNSSSTSQQLSSSAQSANIPAGSSSGTSSSGNPTSSFGTNTTTKPAVSSNSTSSTVKKSAFARPFDTAAIRSELISYGRSIGMTHITNYTAEWGGGQITLNGTTWLPPEETRLYSDTIAAAKLKQDLYDTIKRWKSNGESTFTLWFEKDSKYSGEYLIYIIIA